MLQIGTCALLILLGLVSWTLTGISPIFLINVGNTDEWLAVS